MTYRISGLFAALAIMALAVAVGTASASAASFHQTEANTIVHGFQMTTHVFTVEGSEFTCSDADFDGKAGPALTEPTVSVHPVYAGCTGFTIAGGEVNTEECLYTFHAETSLGGTEAPVNLTGCKGGHITLSVEAPFGLAKCVVQVPNQSGINGQKYLNQVVGTKHEVEVITNSNNIKAEVLISKGFCPLKVTEKGKTVLSTYKGTSTVEGNRGSSGLSWG
jgi:hypothetical protein